MTDAQKLVWYRRMIQIRLFEDKVQELFQQDSSGTHVACTSNKTQKPPIYGGFESG